MEDRLQVGNFENRTQIQSIPCSQVVLEWLSQNH
jgi:hypothetical protein